MERSDFQRSKERLLKILELNRAGMNIPDILPLLNVSNEHYKYLKYRFKSVMPKEYLKKVNVLTDKEIIDGFAEAERTGVTVSDYCRNHGLNIKSFFSRYYSRCVGDAPQKRNLSESVISEISWSTPVSYEAIKARVEIPDRLIRKSKNSK